MTSNEIIEFRADMLNRESVPMSDLMDKTFDIVAIEFDTWSKGEQVFIKVEGHEKYFRCTGKVIIKQLQYIEDFTNQGKKVRVSMTKVKDYYMFK